MSVLSMVKRLSDLEDEFDAVKGKSFFSTWDDFLLLKLLAVEGHGSLPDKIEGYTDNELQMAADALFIHWKGIAMNVNVKVNDTDAFINNGTLTINRETVLRILTVLSASMPVYSDKEL